VEEQVPFCPSCRAPQIKVSTGQDAPVDGSEPATWGASPPPRPFSISAATTSARIQWKSFFQIALPLAIANGVLTSVMFPLGLLIFLPGSVLWAIHIYRRRVPGPLSTGRGAKLGSVLGLLSFAPFAVFFSLLIAHNRDQAHQIIVQAAHEEAVRNPDPVVQPMLHFFTDTDAGLIVFVLFFLAFILVLFLLFAAAAGALSVAFSRDKQRS
jgi:hypothetical protein